MDALAHQIPRCDLALEDLGPELRILWVIEIEVKAPELLPILLAGISKQGIELHLDYLS